MSSTSVDDEAEAEVEVVEVEAREDEGQVRVGRVPEVVRQERKERCGNQMHPSSSSLGEAMNANDSIVMAYDA